MATARKRATTKPTPGPDPVPCESCQGTGLVDRPIRVGRQQRNVGDQQGACLACWGTGEAPTPDPT
ncbi:DnaJ-class molecular chaperone [Streptacidiphilus sp. MAP12-16]